jgi:hypothetical protein
VDTGVVLYGLGMAATLGVLTVLAAGRFLLA